MQRIAVVSDIHSNLEALEAVLSQLGDEKVYCLGDVVGYGANPNEVLDRIRGLGVGTVMGNHDYAAVTGDTDMFNDRAAAAVRWTAKELTPGNLDYLRSLPRESRVELDGVKVYMTHGSPDDPLWEYVDPGTHSGLFGDYLRRLDVGLIALGHTHVPYVWAEGGGTVFNPGSVGQPRDGDRRASYAVVAVDKGHAEVEVHRVEYDHRRAAEKIRRAGLPEQLAKRLSLGL